MSRILMTTQSPLAYGSSRMLAHYAVALKADGHEVTVAYEFKPPSSDQNVDSILPTLTSHGISVTHVPKISLAMVPLATRGLVDVVRSLKSDLIISSQLRDAAGAMAVAKRCGIAGVVLAQAPSVFRGSAVTRWIKKCLYRQALRVNATKIVCVAPNVRNKLTKNFNVPVEKSLVVLNGLDLDSIPLPDPKHRSEVRQEFDLDDDQFVFQGIGRFDSVKGFDILVSAVHKMVTAETNKQKPNFKVLIAAGAHSKLTASYRDQILAMIERLEVQDYIQFIGFRKDCYRLLQAADCFVLSSRSEGLPLVVLEAFAARCPVIISEYGEHFSGFRNDVDGVYVPVEDPTALGAAMLRMLERTPKQRTDIGLNGRQFLEQNLTLDKCKREFVKVINDIL